MIFFTDIEEVSSAITVPHSFELSNFATHMEQVQNKELKNIVGQDTLSAMEVDFTDNGVTGAMGGLIKAARNVVAVRAFYHMIPQINVQLTNGGITQASDNENYMAASRWRTKELESSLLRMESDYWDVLLDYLDTNEALPAYALYLASDERAAWKRSFIYKPEVANRYISVGLSFYILHRMQPIINRVARKCLLPVMCSELFNELVGFNASGTDWGVYEPLRYYAEEVVINMAMSDAVSELRLTVSDDGVGVVFNREDKSVLTGQQNEMALLDARAKWRSNANEALTSLRSELRKNSTNYPLYASSECAAEYTAAGVYANCGGLTL